jgi:hypothetical protein
VLHQNELPADAIPSRALHAPQVVVAYKRVYKHTQIEAATDTDTDTATERQRQRRRQRNRQRQGQG